MMGCDALNLGSKDFAAGLVYLKQLEEKAGFPFISANIKTRENRQAFDPYKIIRRNGISLGVIGVTSLFNHPELSFDDPIAAVEKYSSEILDQADYLVVLFHGDDPDIAKLRELDIPINLVIQSKSRKRSNDGGSAPFPVFACGDRGKYVYQFDFNVSESGSPLVDLSYLRAQKKSWSQKLIRYRQDRKKENADIQSIEVAITKTKSKISNFDVLIAEAINTLDYKRLEMGKTVEHRPDVLEIIDQGKSKIAEITTHYPSRQVQARTVRQNPNVKSGT